MAGAVGWRNFWWLNTALLGFTALCCIFFFPETRYNRALALDSTPVSLSLPILQDDTPEGSDQSAREIKANETVDSEKCLPSLSEHPVTPHNRQGSWLGRGRPSKVQWKLAQAYEGNIFLEFFLPLKLCLFPIVEFSAFVVSWSASSFLTLNLTQSQAFAAPPYNFSSTKIGFFNFAILVGGLIGLFTAGPLSDIVAARLTKRNRGIREPEMRLLAMIPYVIIMIIGNIVVAIGYQRAWDWKVCSDCKSHTENHLLMISKDYRNNWLHLRWYPSCCITVNIIDLLH
jgi:hypothetical protein